MIVNIHNYEAYFLLYVDNELSAKEKAAVELFVQQNPFYQNELSLLQNSKLVSNNDLPGEGNLVYENKLSLYQISELDTQCLAYLDNEMPTSEIKKFEQSLQVNPSLLISLTQWRKSKFTIEDELTLDSAFKNTLYKKEASIKPLWGWYAKYGIGSVAAILMLFIGYKMANTTQKNATDTLLTRTAIPKTPITKPVLNDEVVQLIRGSVAVNHKQWAPATNITLEPTTIVHNDPVENKVEYNTELPKITLPEAITAINPIEIEIENKPLSEPIAIPISYKEIDIEQEDEDRILYIGNLEIDKTKFREVGRKISALFKKNKLEKEK